jgi:hypothetical protein
LELERFRAKACPALDAGVGTGSREENSSSNRAQQRKIKGGTARRDKNRRSRAASLKFLAGKCGFASQPERRFHGSDRNGIGNAIPILT